MYQFYILFLLFSLTSISWAGENKLTLQQIYNDKEYKSADIGDFQWMLDGDHVTTLEYSKSTKGAKDIVSIDIKTNKKTVLVKAKQLILKPKSKPITIDGYQFNKAADKLIVFTNKERSWRHDDAGNYWLIDLKSGSKRQLGGKSPSKHLYFPTLSPSGDKIAYVLDNNLVVEHVISGRIEHLT